MDEELDDAERLHSSGGSELDFLEDEDDIINDGGDLNGLVTYPSNSSDDDHGSDGEWQGFGTDEKTQKRGRDKEESRTKKRRKLATFASYEDYAEMIERGQEDNI